MSRLNRSDAFLLVIDVQQNLMPVIHGAPEVERNIDRLVRGCNALGVPVIVTEQYVKGLGATATIVRKALEESGVYKPIEKMCFSAHGCAEFSQVLRELARTQVIVCGIETHICVYQTVTDLLAAGYEVTLIADALSSRTAENKEIALRRMQSEGAKLSSTEMALFELLVISGTDEFRAVSRLVK